MNAVAPIGDVDLAMPDRPEACNIVVLYDDAESHNAAMEICERIMSEFDGDVLFDFHCWRLREFASALFSDTITGTIADADVLIFASRGDDLPYPVRRCLELCINRRAKPDGALGLLLVEPASSSAAVGTLLSRLEYAAARLHMDFLTMFGAGDAPFAHWQQQAMGVTARIKGSLEQPQSHWGLNE